EADKLLLLERTGHELTSDRQVLTLGESDGERDCRHLAHCERDGVPVHFSELLRSHLKHVNREGCLVGQTRDKEGVNRRKQVRHSAFELTTAPKNSVVI